MTETDTITEAHTNEATSHEMDTPAESLSTPDGVDRQQESAERLVPVSEARRYRKRAQAAEHRVRELEQDLDQRREQLAQREQQLDELARQRAIDHALHENEVIDADVAAVLIVQQLDDDEATDIDDAVQELRRRKPYLFRPQRPATSTTALGPRPDEHNGQLGGRLEHAAEQAIRTGRRSELLRYLSLRRRQR